MIKSKHSLGQNFLIDNNVLNSIIESINANSNDIIIEIGPGMGALTKRLKELPVNHIYAFEIDQRMHTFLDSLVDDKLSVIYNDFLKIHLNDYINNKQVIHIIANIPYYITTPIIEHIIDAKINVSDMVLMVQKEVADRLSSLPGHKDYGYITAYLNYYFIINKLFNVSKKCFNPVPKVESAVIKLSKRKDMKVVVNETLLNKLLKDAFQYKRKNIKNNLKAYDLNAISSVLNNYNHNLTNRAEDISIDEFIAITNKIAN